MAQIGIDDAESVGGCEQREPRGVRRRTEERGDAGDEYRACGGDRNAIEDLRGPSRSRPTRSGSNGRGAGILEHDTRGRCRVAPYPGVSIRRPSRRSASRMRCPGGIGAEAADPRDAQPQARDADARVALGAA